MARVSLPLLTLLLCSVAAARVRHRREWIPPRNDLLENHNYHDEVVGRIFSDSDNRTGNIVYSLEGVGASQLPFNVFVVNAQTGDIRVTRPLDREQISEYNLTGVARYMDDTLAEQKILLRFKVLDENDNAPEFGIIQAGAVNELSPTGTSIMKITATDADEGINAQIAYSIVSQSPNHDMFTITPSGELRLKRPDLDREESDQYVVVIKGQDMNGDPRGKAGTGTVTINVGDVNDNPLTLEKDKYEATILENTYGMEVMRLKAEDLDLVKTPNWEADFDIVQGNEAGYFEMKTDPITNEGILMLVKPLYYENVKDLDLSLAVKNKVDLVGVGGGGGGGGPGLISGPTGAGGGGGGGGGYKTYPLKINVKNQPEGPRFEPNVKAIPISESGDSFNINSVIGKYPAMDQDTGNPAENVRYIKGKDPGNWLTIDPITSEIKLNKLPDRESPLLENGTYYAQVLCVTEDMPAKTATGTIAIQVEDFNDHCPVLTSPVQTLCLSDTAVVVNAYDGDKPPNGAPLHFTIVPENTQGKWHVEHLNDTAVILRTHETPWPGEYEVEFIVTDQQGESCPEPQRVKIQVCTCEEKDKCGPIGGDGKPKKTVEFGPAGIGMLFLGLLLLLLLLLLALFCLCGGAGGLPGGFAEMPFDTKSRLINYRTEGQGENTEVPLVNLPLQTDANLVDLGMVNKTAAMGQMSAMDLQQRSFASMDAMNGGMGYGAAQMDGTWRGMSQMGGSGFHSEYMSRETEGGIFDGMALPHYYLGQYYNQKAEGMEAQAGKENLLVYNYEGQGSSAGSISCLSDLALDNDLHFLDDLDPKFKTLAEICGGKIQTEVSAPPPSASITSHTAVSSVLPPQPLPQLTPKTPPAPRPQPVPLPQPALRTEVSSSVVRESSDRSQTVTVTEVNRETPSAPRPQGQMLLVQQQPQVYYTTAPVLQPMHYMVQPPVQNTVLLAEAPGPNLQNVMLVNGPQTGPAQGLVVQGQTLLQGQTLVQGQASGPGVVLVEKGQGPGASLSGSQPMVLVEGKGSSGAKKVLNSSKSVVQPGLSGSQTVLVMGSAQGQQPVALSGAQSGSQRILVMGPHSAQIQEGNTLSGALAGSLKALNKNISTTITNSSSTGNISGNSIPTGSRRVVLERVSRQ